MHLTENEFIYIPSSSHSTYCHALITHLTVSALAPTLWVVFFYNTACGTPMKGGNLSIVKGYSNKTVGLAIRCV